MTRPVLAAAGQRRGRPAAAPLLRRIAADPDAPLIATIVGPGGAGKTATLDAVAQGYQQAGVEVARHRAGSLPGELDPDRPVLIDDAHRLDGRHLDADPRPGGQRCRPAGAGAPAVAAAERAAGG